MNKKSEHECNAVREILRTALNTKEEDVVKLASDVVGRLQAARQTAFCDGAQIIHNMSRGTKDEARAIAIDEARDLMAQEAVMIANSRDWWEQNRAENAAIAAQSNDGAMPPRT
jgi:hypothetical protein